MFFPQTCFYFQNKQSKAEIISVITQQNTPKLDPGPFIACFLKSGVMLERSCFLLHAVIIAPTFHE